VRQLGQHACDQRAANTAVLATMMMRCLEKLGAAAHISFSRTFRVLHLGALPWGAAFLFYASPIVIMPRPVPKSGNAAGRGMAATPVPCNNKDTLSDVPWCVPINKNCQGPLLWKPATFGAKVIFQLQIKPGSLQLPAGFKISTVKSPKKLSSITLE